MKVEPLLNVNTALLTVLGTVLLGMATGSLLFPSIVVVAAVVSLWLTDHLGLFSINRLAANILALSVAAYCVFDFFLSQPDNLFEPIATFLVLLQIVLLFQRKAARVYWELMILSLLLVVVSAALEVTPQSGIWIVAYMAAGVSAMMLLHTQTESARFTAQPHSGGPARQAAGPLAAEFLIADRRLARPVVSRRLFGQITLFTITTFTMTAVLFCSMPRHRDARWSTAERANNVWSQTGFRPELNLRRNNPIYASPAEVMRVTLTDYATGKPYQLDAGPYLRGAVLVGYTGRRWHPQTEWATRNVGDLPDPPTLDGLVRVEVLLENAHQRLLFGVYPVWRDANLLDVVRFDEHFEQLVGTTKGFEPLDANYRYATATSAFRGGRQLQVIPYQEDGGKMPLKRRSALTQLEPTRGPRQFANLQAIADDLRSARGQELGPYETARRLERHFAQASRYTYSLDSSDVPRNWRLHPLEDFVANHRTGHCEYFAGALALMLRSQGIPSRIVLGYKGGEFNPVGNYYLFRELHSHAWVEAYLDTDHVPAEVLANSSIDGGGVWLRLDPTPSSVVSEEGDLADYVQTLWDDYVLNYDSHRQRETVVQSWAEDTDDWLGMTPANWSKIPPRTWLPIVLVLVLILTGLAAYRLIATGQSRAVLRWLQRLAVRCKRWLSPYGHAAGATGQSQQQTRISVEFYERLAALLARRGLTRVSNQTHREFARAAQVCIAGLLPEAQVNDVPLRIVEFFYRVRFGHDVLEQAEIDAIDSGLRSLEAALPAG